MNFKNLFKTKNNQSDVIQPVHNLIRSMLSETDKDIAIEGHLKLVDDLGFDSIKFINVMLGIEDLIQKDIESIAAEIDLTEIQTVDDLVQFVISQKK